MSWCAAVETQARLRASSLAFSLPVSESLRSALSGTDLALLTRTLRPCSRLSTTLAHLNLTLHSPRNASQWASSASQSARPRHTLRCRPCDPSPARWRCVCLHNPRQHPPFGLTSNATRCRRRPLRASSGLDAHASPQKNRNPFPCDPRGGVRRSPPRAPQGFSPCLATWPRATHGIATLFLRCL